MTIEFDPDQPYSQIIGSSIRKWIQNGVYFDRNFEPLDQTSPPEELQPPPVLKGRPVALPTPRPEGNNEQLPDSGRRAAS